MSWEFITVIIYLVFDVFTYLYYNDYLEEKKKNKWPFIHSIIMSLFSLAKSSSENEVYIYYGKIEKTWRSKGSCLSQNHTFDNNNKMVVGRGIFELRCCYSIFANPMVDSNICKWLSWSLINSLSCYLILVIRQHTWPNISETRWHNC